jgi:hypothetical protein
MEEKIKKFVDKYVFEVNYIDESFDDEIEDFMIPLRKKLQNYPEALDEIVGADEKLIKEYEKLSKDSYLKEILAPVYCLAKKNVEAHLKAL